MKGRYVGIEVRKHGEVYPRNRMERGDRGSKGNRGKVEKEEKQRKLITEEGKIMKRVSFKRENITGSELDERIKEVKEEFWRVWGDWKEGEDRRMKEMEDRIVGIERVLEELREEKRMREEESLSNSSRGREKGRDRSSRTSSAWNLSRISETLSEKEINALKKMVDEKDKEERKENIVIKGEGIVEEPTNKGVEDLIKKLINVEIKVKNCWRSGKVMVIKIENEDTKKEIMLNKHRLKGKKIFIENDLTYEERKIQGKIGEWARKEAVKGNRIKISKGRVKIGDTRKR